MTIKQVAKKYGITSSALRYYESIGVVPHVHRNASGIRDYTENDEAWVSLAHCMRSAGLSMEALAEYVRLFQMGDKTIARRHKLLKEQRDELREKRRQIDEALALLDYKVDVYEKRQKRVCSIGARGRESASKSIK